VLHVVIPVYNEHESIGETLDGLRSAVASPFDVRIVYDFDEDSTLPAVRLYLERQPGLTVTLLRNTAGRGVVHAIRTGLMSVQEGAALVVMADTSDDYRIIDAMLARIDAGYDVVCASRYCSGGQQIGGPWLKGLMSRLAGLSLHFFTGLPTRDVTNSFKMYSAGLLSSLQLESRGGFEIGMEIVVKAFAAGRRITEIPATWRDRSHGESRFRLVAWLPNYLHWYWYALKSRWLPAGWR
jgi:glycosyltransferase involved in cell wall biosynthesis